MPAALLVGGSDTVPVPVPIHARVFGSQGLIPAGVYADTIVVSVDY